MMADEDEIITDEEDVDEDEIRQQRMREFNDLVHILFTKPERLILYKILKDYQRRRDVVRLVVGLDLVLRTYTKLELLKYVRYFVAQGHLDEFDSLTQFRAKFRLRKHKGSHLLVPDHRSVASTSTYASGRNVKDVRVFTVQRDKEEPNLGFCVRGGSEHGLGIYVSETDAGSAAGSSGIEVGDKILEVNNISLRGMSSSTAVKVLTGSNRLKLVIQRTRKIPEWRLSREKTSWYDVHNKKLMSGEFEECGISHNIRGLEVEVPERRINLKFGKDNQSLGFNIRGGREFGLGIYVSKVDRDGLANENGVRIGDQLIDVNGIPFENITHANAVEVLKGKRHLILTLRDVGRFPVYKELYAEYTWSDSHIKPGSSTLSLRDVHVVQEDLPSKARSVSDLFSGRRKPSALHNEIFLPGENRFQTSDAGEDIELNMNGDDDTDSLIDLDQWAKDIQDTGTENYAYVNDEEEVHRSLSTENSNDKYIHVNDDSVSSRQRSAGDDKNATVSVQEIDADYDTTDMIYAKINKRNEKYASTSYLRVRKESVSSNIYKNRTSETVMPSSSHEDISEKYYKSTEDRLASSNEELNTMTPSIEGALYSTVRRLSGGSFKNLTGSTLSIYGSDKSIKDKVIDNHFDTIEAHSAEKRRQRHESLSYSENNDTDSSEEEHGADSYDVSSPYLAESRKFEEQQIQKAEARKLEEQHIQKAEARKLEEQHIQKAEARKLEEQQIQKAEARKLEEQQIQKAEALKLEEQQIQKAEARKLEEQQIQKAEARKLEEQRILKADDKSHDENNDGNDHLDLETLEERLQALQARQRTIGLQELNTLNDNDQDMTFYEGNVKKKGKWRNFKHKVKGSLRLKSPSHTKRGSLGINRSTDIPEYSAVTKKGWKVEKVDSISMTQLEEAAKKLLDEDEFKAVKRHIKTYHENHDVERLVDVLLVILDKPEKLTLLKDVRGVIYQHDMGKFDNMVNHYEIEAYQTLSMKLHLPLNHKQQKKPRRKLITTEIENPSDVPNADKSLESDPGEAEDGHFHIKTMGRSNKQKKIVDLMKENVEESKVSRTSLQRQGRFAEEKSALDQFEYLEFEHSEEGSCIAAFSDNGSYETGDIEKVPGNVIVHLSTTKQSIGIEFVEEMVNGEKEVKIDSIDPHGAANDDSTIKVGMIVLAVDRHRVDGLSLEEVCGIIDTLYMEKQHVSMKLVLRNPESTDF